MDIRVIMWTKHQKTYISLCFTIMQTRCIRGNNMCSRPTLLPITTLPHENRISYEMITKCCNHLLSYCLTYFGDKCEILIYITFWQTVHCGGFYIYIYIYQITNYHWYCRVIKEHWSRVWCVIALKTESRHDAKFIITGGATGCYCGAHSDDKIGIVTTVDFIYSWSSEHQNYDCKTLPLATISCKWMSFVSPFFIH